MEALPSAGATSAPTSRYGGFWIRVLAAIIDGLIVGGVSFALIRGTGAITVTCPADQPLDVNCAGGATTISPMLYVFLALPVLYYIVLWGIKGTVGQRALGLRVVDASTGKAIGIPRALLRYIGLIIASIPLWLGVFWVGWDARKQGWHDKMANSVVTRKS